MPVLAKQSGGDVTALAGLAVDDQSPARRHLVEAAPQLLDRDVDRARDRPAANSPGVRTSIRTSTASANQSGRVLDMDLRGIAPRHGRRDEAGHVDRVLGRAELGA